MNAAQLKHLQRLVLLGVALAHAACAPEAPRSLVFVSLDTTRRDHLSVYGYPRQTTPHLARLGERGALFLNAFAQQTRTLPSHASMFTGLYPHEHGSVSGLHPLERTQTTLAEVLSDAGFRTAAFVSGYTMVEKWGLDQGFGSYDDHFTGMSRWPGGRRVSGPGNNSGHCRRATCSSPGRSP